MSAAAVLRPITTSPLRTTVRPALRMAGPGLDPRAMVRPAAAYTVVVPARHRARVTSVRHGARPVSHTATVYVRRRLLVAALFVAVVVAVWGGAGGALAGGEGGPGMPVVRATTVARAGDTLWSIAAAHHGDRPSDEYLDDLLLLNGGASLQIGQQVLLP